MKLQGYGNELMELCPFHDDHEPRLCIDPIANIWNYKGACSVGASAIDWVMKAEGVSLRHAVEFLREGLAVGLEELVKTSTVRKLAAPVTADASDAETLVKCMRIGGEQLSRSWERCSSLLESEAGAGWDKNRVIGPLAGRSSGRASAAARH